MRAFLDTNILIDFLDQRPGFFRAAAQIMAKAYNGEIEVVISATSVINAFYILRKTFNTEDLKETLNNVFKFCLLAGISKESVFNSLNNECRDFEDAVQIYTAQEAGADCIITRDTRHFVGSALPIFNPEDFLTALD